MIGISCYTPPSSIFLWRRKFSHGIPAEKNITKLIIALSKLDSTNPWQKPVSGFNRKSPPDHWFSVSPVSSSRSSCWPSGNTSSFNTISLCFFHSISHLRNFFSLRDPVQTEFGSLNTNVCNSLSTFPCNLLAYCATPNTLVVSNHQILLHAIASFQSDSCLLGHARTLVVSLYNSGPFRQSMTVRYTPSIV